MSSRISGMEIIIRLLSILVIRKKWIILFALLGSTAAGVIVMVVPKTFRSTTVIKPPSSKSMGMGPLSSLMEGSGALTGLMSSFFSSSSGEGDCLSILESIRFSWLVIQEFDLETVYKFRKKKKYFKADVLKAFSKKRMIETTDEDAIKISVEDKSPERAAAMLTYMTRLLDSLYTDVQKTSLLQKLDYFNSRVNLAESDMKIMEDSLMAFQKENNLFMPETQIKTILGNVGNIELQIEMINQQMELESALRGPSTQKYRRLELQKQHLKTELNERFRSQTDSNSIILPINVMPAIAMEYYRLERQYRIKLTLYQFLIQNVEALKLEIASNMQTITVIDPPWVNDKKVAPRRRLIVEMIFVLLLIAGSIGAVLFEILEKQRQENSEIHQLLQSIRKNLFSFR